MTKDNSKKNKQDNKKEAELQAYADELKSDLQRLRADFENYRKRTESDLERARAIGKSNAIIKLLPVIDNIERAISHMPETLKDDKWAQGVTGLTKNLDKSMESLGIKRIDAKAGTSFNPELHEAVMSEEGDGDEPVIVQEMQAGYTQDGKVIRHSMVKVKQ